MWPTKPLGKDGRASLEDGRVKNTVAAATSFSVTGIGHTSVRLHQKLLPSTRIFLLVTSYGLKPFPFGAN